MKKYDKGAMEYHKEHYDKLFYHLEELLFPQKNLFERGEELMRGMDVEMTFDDLNRELMECEEEIKKIDP
jgi:hypothetical protein